jgi:hypothetical protein
VATAASCCSSSFTGRAYLNLSGHENATRAFYIAGQTAEVVLGLNDDQNDSVAAFPRELSSLKTTAALGRANTRRLEDACDKLSLCMPIISSVNAKAALGHVNTVLEMATLRLRGYRHCLDRRPWCNKTSPWAKSSIRTDQSASTRP